MYEIQENVFPLQPRERLLANGAESLSERELLAILLRTGSKDYHVFELAGRVLETFVNLENLRNATLKELEMIKGIGPIKAVELQAMIELGKRIHNASREFQGTIMRSETFGRKMMNELANLEQEHLLAVYLDNRNHIIAKKTIFIGTVNSAPAVPREILHHAVRFIATGILVVHNHPSGNPEPSEADIQFTQNLENSCQMLGTNLIDHLVVGREDYFSFREKNLL
ncbi:MAG: DNA repair protein RadC [Streptococcaceae bacterium]|jgi:DNA repair protein RadC|nr:DNA repair protein RadC [Streptococcaceae bacterium]